MMIRPILLTVAVTVSLAAPAAAQTADEVVEKHLAAMGGRAALAKLSTQVAKGTASVSTPAGNIGGTVESYRKVPNKSRTLMVLDLSQFGQPDVVVDQRCDGTAAWAGNSMQGDRDLSGDQLQGLLNNSFPSLLLDYKNAGATVELTGKDTVGGRPAFVVAFKPRAGSPMKLFFDAETYDLVRSVSTIEAPGMGMIEQTSDPSDYRVIDGIRVAFAVALTNPGQSITITMTSVAFNVPVDDAMFVKPTK